MLPFRIVSNKITNNESYRRFTQNSLVMNWGWLISFFMISIFNGWMINVSQIEPFFLDANTLRQAIAIYFAIFPLAATSYIVFKSTAFLVTSLVSSRLILAVALCYLTVPAFNSLLMGFLGFNILLFIFILIFVSKTRGILFPAFILFFALVLFLIGYGGWAFHIVWYCNLIVTANKSGRQLRSALDSFDAAMISLTGIGAVGLAVGWIMGGFSR
ncbi:hypothetical protein Riv7116_0300 [Rivularia sp. PCC 7116]|nr:hypothetical protein Riv7116_0300 [Rivularia sp. PCC 7116]